MTREEFVFTIGFQGDAAIVDAKAKRQYGKHTTRELAEQGLYRAAFCSAIYSANESEMNEFVEFFAEKSGMAGFSVDRLKQLFGVYTVPDEVKRVITL